ncbi:MAG: nucleotide exchange factor GrpE [Betaproteobacteria bacterium]
MTDSKKFDTEDLPGNDDIKPVEGSNTTEDSVPTNDIEKEQTEPTATDEVEALRVENEKLKEEWLRAKAETENVRKRAETDVRNAHKYGVERLATELLAVSDSLEAALALETVTTESLQDGVGLTLKQLQAVFEKFNIKEINPVGEILDPHRHQAMAALESDAPENSIINVFQKGYELNDRLIRPAMVSVSKKNQA